MFVGRCILLEPDEPKVCRSEDGIFTISNAYDGWYGYFRGRPIFRVKDGTIVEWAIIPQPSCM